MLHSNKMGSEYISKELFFSIYFWFNFEFVLYIALGKYFFYIMNEFEIFPVSSIIIKHACETEFKIFVTYWLRKIIIKMIDTK